MAFTNIYDSIELIFSLLSFLGLAPYAFRSKSNIPFLKLDYFSLVCAVVVLGLVITFEVIYVQQDIINFQNEKEPIDRLTILTYCMSTNLRRTIIVVYFVTPLLYHKKLANVIKTLYETDQILSMKGIAINHKKVFFAILGLLIISFVHVIIKTVSELTVTIKSFSEFFYNLFIQTIHAFFTDYFLVLTYLLGQRFAKLTEYLSLHNEKESSIVDEKKLAIRQAWISVGCDNNITILNNSRNFSPDNTLSNSMNLHAVLQKCMEELSECFQIPLMLLFIHEFLNIIYCFYIFYGVIAYGVAHLGTMDQLMVEVHSFIQAYAKVAALTWCCDVLSDESKKIIRVVSTLSRRSDITIAEKRKLRQFFLQLIHEDIGVSVMGCYNIDNLAHFSMLTTMFNYLMVTISLRYY